MLIKLSFFILIVFVTHVCIKNRLIYSKICKLIPASFAEVHLVLLMQSYRNVRHTIDFFLLYFKTLQIFIYRMPYAFNLLVYKVTLEILFIQIPLVESE